MAQAALTLKGERELMRQLNKLPDKLFTKVQGKAASKAMTPVNRTAKKNAKAVEDTGATRRATGKRTKKYRRTNTVVVVVGVKKDHVEVDSKGQRHRPSKTVHLVEFGHRIAGGGHVAARPLYRHAMDTNKDRVTVIYKRELGVGLDRVAKETSK